MAPAPDQCPADIEEVAEAYVMGSLPEAVLTAFKEHLLLCGRCMAAVESATQYVRAMREAARRLERKPKVRAAR